jgi:hypothetical protein
MIDLTVHNNETHNNTLKHTVIQRTGTIRLRGKMDLKVRKEGEEPKGTGSVQVNQTGSLEL